MSTLLTSLAAARPDGPALTDDDGVTLTWTALDERVDRWSAVLRDLGLVRGDRVAMVLGNRRETIECLLACLHTGCTAVPVNWHLTAPEVAYILADSGARAVVTDPERLEVVAAAATSAPDCRARLVTGPSAGRDWLLPSGFRAAEGLLGGTVADDALSVCGSLMLYTSGTTGAPKGVQNGLFTEGAPFDRVGRLTRYATKVLRMPQDGAMLLAGPWYHSAQLFFALLGLLNGNHLVVHARFDPGRTLEAVDQHGICAVHLVPTQFVRLLRLPQAQRERFSGASLRTVWHGGGPCPAEVKRAMIDWWGPVVTEYYAATEGGVVTLISAQEWLEHPGSVGRAVPPNEILVVGETGERLPAGVSGRVFVARRTGAGFHYHNAPEKTREAHLAPGVFTYGELGQLDDEGYLYLTGRASDLVVTGGVNVYPAEVERVLIAHPAVTDAAVIGVPDDEFGERVVAVVAVEPQTAAGASTSVPDLLDEHCRRSLAGFKVPRDYRVVDAATGLLPREPTGKLRKDVIRALYLGGHPGGHPGEHPGETATTTQEHR